MRYIIVVFLLIFIGSKAYSQHYTRDAGFRVGEGFFICYRQFFDEEKAIEGLVGFSKDGFKITALREYFNPLTFSSTDKLRLMFGYGVHLGVDYTNNYEVFNQIYYHDWMWSPKFGFDGIIGLDYASTELPFVISAAAQPYFEYSLNQYFRLKPVNFVISFKYRF